MDPRGPSKPTGDADMTQTIVDLISQHTQTALAVVFFVSLGEALFLIGLFIPSTVVLVAAGGLVGAGKLPFLPILLLASAGAVVGDALSFWVGHHFKGRLRSVWPFSRYGALIDKGEAFFGRHGGKSIFIGRFVPGVKAIVPGIAGMVGMNFGWFSVINVVSAFAWAGAHIIPAAGIGRGLSRVHSFDPRLAILGVVLLATLLVLYYLGKIAYGFAYPVFDRWRLGRIERRGPSASRLARYETHILSNHRNIVGWTLVLMVAALAAGGFLTLLGNLLFDPELKLIDKAVYNFLQSFRSDAGTRIVTAVTMAADGFVLTGLSLALVAWLLIRRHFRVAVTAAMAVATSSLFVPLVKGIIQRPRPTMLYAGAESFSFPSGHATLSMTVFGVLAVIVASHLAPRWRPLAIGAAIGAALIIAFTRLYLGAHWLSDVAAGVSFGLLVTAIFAFLTRRQDRAIRLGPLLAVLLPVYLGTYSYHLWKDYDRWTVNYAPVPIAEQISPQEWLADGWRRIAERRLTIAGDQAEVLRIQTDLSLSGLTVRLEPSGWTPLAVGGLLETLLPSRVSLAERPAAPLLHDGRRPVAAYAKPGPASDQRLILTFWPSSFQLGPGEDGRPVLVGGLSLEMLDPIAGGYAILEIAEDSQVLSNDLDSLIQSLAPGAAPTADGDILLLPKIGASKIEGPVLEGRRP